MAVQTPRATCELGIPGTFTELSGVGRVREALLSQLQVGAVAQGQTFQKAGL